MNQKKRLSVKTVVLIGMFGALAAVLETFQIPVPFAPPFYKLDFAETPIMIGAFALGPVPAILMELVKNHPLMKGAFTGHFHFTYNDPLPNGAQQYLTAGSFLGMAREIEIV